MPMDKRIVKPTQIQKVTNRYQNVNKNEFKFRGKIPVDIEYGNNKQKTNVLITERTDITPRTGNGLDENIQTGQSVKYNCDKTTNQNARKYSTDFWIYSRTMKQ